MYNWDKVAEKCTVNCDYSCGSNISVNKSDFTKTQWEAFDPETRLWESAQQLGWDIVWDDNAGTAIQACKRCIDKIKMGL